MDTDKIEQAASYKKNNNCCQAVLLAFKKDLGMEEDALLALGAPFGSGMGGMQGTCGALVGAQMLLGFFKYQGRPMHKEAKTLYEGFQKRCGATLCRELKGIDTGKILCSCEDCVRNACRELLPLLEA